VRLLYAPLGTAVSNQGVVTPGTRFDAFERHGDFVHVRGDDFEGYLPVSAVRLL
jgi:hypothetical protein